MAAPRLENVCLYNKFGYCKYRETCKLRHVKELCSERDCEIDKCCRRHPRECRFYRDYNRCKFGEFCFFTHLVTQQKVVMSDVKAERIETKLKTLEKQNEEMSEKILKLMNNIDEKTFEVKNLEIKITNLEKESHDKITNIENLGKKVKEVEENYFILVHAVDDLEKTTNFLKHNLPSKPQKFTCNICGQEFQNESTMRNHIRRSHGTFKT